jgi:hypothetical protein
MDDQDSTETSPTPPPGTGGATPGGTKGAP